MNFPLNLFHVEKTLFLTELQISKKDTLALEIIHVQGVQKIIPLNEL